MIELLLLCMMISCGPTPSMEDPIIPFVGPKKFEDPREKNGIDPEFAPYVALFTKLAKRKVTNLPIHFGEVGGDGERVGVCIIHSRIYSPIVYKEVFIKKEYWNKATEYQKEVLILHELGHCVLNREHSEETMLYKEYNTPASIMYPYIIGGNYYYEPNRGYYHKELLGSQ